MAHRRGSFRGRGISESQRRKKLWSPFFAPATSVDFGSVGDISNTLHFGVTTGPLLTSPTGQAFAYAFDAGDLQGIQPESTLMRIRGSLLMPKNVVQPTEIETFAFGIGVMETGAAQQAAFPNPATPEGSRWDGWMFYRSTEVSAVDSEGTVVDVKSMRKIQSGYSLIIVMGSSVSTFTSGAAASAPAFVATFTARGLFLLP